MVEAACSAAAAAGSRGDAGGSSVAGLGARCFASSRRLHLVSRSACRRQHKQVRELGQRPPTPGWTRCQQLAPHGAGQEEGAGREVQKTEQWSPEKPSLQGTSALGRCHNELMFSVLHIINLATQLY